MIFAKKNSSQLSFHVGWRVWPVWLTFLLGWAAASGMLPRVCTAHIYKDGFVERSLAITIRGESGHGELLIGLNEKTATAILGEAELLKARSEARAKVAGPTKAMASGARKAKQKIGNDVPDGPSNPEKRDSSSGSVSGSASVSGSDLSTSSNRAGPLNNPQSIRDENETRPGEGQHLTNLAMIKRLAAVKEFWALEKLKLTLGGRRIKLKNVSVSPAPRHPYSLVLKFEFDLQEPGVGADSDSTSEPLNLRLVDETFPGQNGAVRYSLRSRGSTILLKSNVAPVIVRAERFEFGEMRSKINSKSFTIDAKLIVDR